MFRRKFPAALLCASVMVTASTSCSGREEEHGLLDASEVCDGTLSRDAVRSLELLTGENKFKELREPGIKEVADDISEEFASRHGTDGSIWDRHTFCSIHEGKSRSDLDASITFNIENRRDLESEEYDPDFDVYNMGRISLSSADEAVIYFNCSSPRMKNSVLAPSLIRAEFVNSQDPVIEKEEEKKANLKILHSAALALAKELRCEENGGLPGAPVLTPVL